EAQWLKSQSGHCDPAEMPTGIPSATSSLSPPALKWLHQAGSDALAEFLACEQPQTIAVAFTRLSPGQAAEVLHRLPADLQVAVVQRLTDLDETDPDVVREVERGLASWLSEQLSRSRRRTAGLSAVARILEASNQAGRQTVL